MGITKNLRRIWLFSANKIKSSECFRKQPKTTNNNPIETFYNINYGSSIIKSKCLSQKLSNQNKHLSFCCLPDKTWIKMPKWNIFVTSSQVFVLITEIFWPTFGRNNWRSIIDVVERLCSCQLIIVAHNCHPS